MDFSRGRILGPGPAAGEEYWVSVHYIHLCNRVKVPRSSPSPSQKIDLHKVRDSTPSAKKVIKKPIKGLKKRKNRLTKVQLLEEQAQNCAKMTQYLTRPGLGPGPVQIYMNS